MTSKICAGVVCSVAGVELVVLTGAWGKGRCSWEPLFVLAIELLSHSMGFFKEDGVAPYPAMTGWVS
jgi:hypothetical protein